MYNDRFIKGLWVAADGCIYRDFGKRNILSDNALNKRLKENPLIFKVIGVDYGGNKSASVFNLVGFDKEYKNVYVLDEVYDGKNESAERLIRSFKEACERWSSDKKFFTPIATAPNNSL